MNTSNLPGFLSRPAFWFAAVNALAVILASFGIKITAEVIVAVNLVVAAAFNVAPPINSYVAAKRYEAAAKSTLYEKNITLLGSGTTGDGLQSSVLLTEEGSSAHANGNGSTTHSHPDSNGNTL